ncbi:MAG: sigma-54-dependent Fis family transcriptional regulator, partial [Alphaproteobacteria bacterium]|nr:sigma-54-dependent Fis family transcriptional regulator [Alphaproteobacteria bacterium]
APGADAHGALHGSPRTGDGSGDPVAPLVGRRMEDVERDLILDTLQHCLGNRTHAATILGISIRTLRNKLQLYRQGGLAVTPPNELERVAL